MEFDPDKWLTATDDELRALREFRANLMTGDELAEMLRVTRRSISNIGKMLKPRRGGGYGIRVQYHIDDVRAYLAALNPDITPDDLLPDFGRFMTPDDVEKFLSIGGVAMSSLRHAGPVSIRVSPKLYRYREEDVAAWLTSLDDDSELCALIRKPSSEALMAS
jgi:hypothetical protein